MGSLDRAILASRITTKTQRAQGAASQRTTLERVTGLVMWTTKLRIPMLEATRNSAFETRKPPLASPAATATPIPTKMGSLRLHAFLATPDAQFAPGQPQRIARCGVQTGQGRVASMFATSNALNAVITLSIAQYALWMVTRLAAAQFRLELELIARFIMPLGV